MNQDIKGIYPEHFIWYLINNQRDGFSPIKFYKTPFHSVSELISRRSCLLMNGFALVAESQRVILVVNAFKDNLIAALEMTAKALPRLDEDDRMIPILNSLAKQYMSKEYSPNGSGVGITHEQIPGLQVHFPPCMQSLSQALTRDAHLKHTSRLYFGLFLKGIGLSLDEALIFWRKSFNRMSDDEFNKKGYSYNIRYNYGMEGKRTNYTPYSCIRIISGMPGPGDTHGCPFRHYSPENLTSMLQNLHVNDVDVQEITRRSKESHYQLACTKLYEVTRGAIHAEANAAQNEMNDGTLMEGIEHPNQWFDLSAYGTSHRVKREHEDVEMER